jgi:MoxR-like ATPase
MISLENIVSLDEISKAQEKIKSVYIAPSLKRYIINLARQTRIFNEVYLGVSPRGSLALFRTSQAYASMKGRDYVIPDDIKNLAVPTFTHRLILAPAARLRDLDSIQVIHEILNNVAVPGGDFISSKS